MSKNFDFQVRGYLPPILEKNFFADLHDLGHKRKKIKKCENDPILARQCDSVKFHTFFFSSETFP